MQQRRWLWRQPPRAHADEYAYLHCSADLDVHHYPDQYARIDNDTIPDRDADTYVYIYGNRHPLASSGRDRANPQPSA